MSRDDSAGLRPGAFVGDPTYAALRYLFDHDVREVIISAPHRAGRTAMFNALHDELVRAARARQRMNDSNETGVSINIRTRKQTPGTTRPATFASMLGTMQAGELDDRDITVELDADNVSEQHSPRVYAALTDASERILLALGVEPHREYAIAVERGPDVHAEQQTLGNVSGSVNVDARVQRLLADSDRLYRLLAIFDTRDGSHIADVVQAAREGYERSAPGMDEADAWSDFDRLIGTVPRTAAFRFVHVHDADDGSPTGMRDTDGTDEQVTREPDDDTVLLDTLSTVVLGALPERGLPGLHTEQSYQLHQQAARAIADAVLPWAQQPDDSYTYKQGDKISVRMAPSEQRLLSISGDYRITNIDNDGTLHVEPWHDEDTDEQDSESSCVHGMHVPEQPSTDVLIARLSTHSDQPGMGWLSHAARRLHELSRTDERTVHADAAEPDTLRARLYSAIGDVLTDDSKRASQLTHATNAVLDVLAELDAQQERGKSEASNDDTDANDSEENFASINLSLSGTTGTVDDLLRSVIWQLQRYVRRSKPSSTPTQ